MSFKKSKAYQHCIDIMRFLVDADYTLEISTKTLKVAITAIRGGDPRTLANWTDTLIRLGFLTQRSYNVFKMNLASVPELWNVVVKTGQKKLM